MTQSTLIQVLLAWISVFFAENTVKSRAYIVGRVIREEFNNWYAFSIIGILFVCLTIMDILPSSTKTMKIVYIGIGWVFIIIGSVIRFKNLKQKQQ